MRQAGLVKAEPGADAGRGGASAAALTKAREAIGPPDLQFHDLRHTGNTMAAGQGGKSAGAH